jgi:hypothetical protein
MLEDLLLDKDENVRLGVAWNPNTPTKTIVLLASDDDKRVRAAATQRIKEIEAGA